MTTIKGTVKDADGQPAVRTLRFYRRDTGAMLGEVESAAGGGWGDVASFATFAEGYEDLALGGDWTDLGGVSIITDDGWLKVDTASAWEVAAPVPNGGFQLDVGGRTFTLEFTVRKAAFGSGIDIFKFGGFTFRVGNSSNSIQIHGAGTSFNFNLISLTPGVNSQNIIAIVCSGGDIQVFNNGVAGNKKSAWWSYDTIHQLFIPTTAHELQIKDVRLTLNQALYTANYTPAAFETPPDDGYSFDTAYEGEVQVVCLADDAAENDLIHRTDTA